MTFAILAALTVSFAIGRIWQIRRDELARRNGFALPTIARIPLPKPKDAEISERDDPLDLAMVGVLTGKRTSERGAASRPAIGSRCDDAQRRE